MTGTPWRRGESTTRSSDHSSSMVLTTRLRIDIVVSRAPYHPTSCLDHDTIHPIPILPRVRITHIIASLQLLRLQIQHGSVQAILPCSTLPYPTLPNPSITYLPPSTSRLFLHRQLPTRPQHNESRRNTTTTPDFLGSETDLVLVWTPFTNEDAERIWNDGRQDGRYRGLKGGEK